MKEREEMEEMKEMKERESLSPRRKRVEGEREDKKMILSTHIISYEGKKEGRKYPSAFSLV